jgi:internalin A
MFIFDQIFFMKYSFPLFLLTLLAFSVSSNGQLQKINTYAGLGTAGFSGDGGIATAAELNGPQSITIDAIGNVYFVDFFNIRVRKINTFGKISTVAGNGNAGSGADGSLATAIPMHPYGVAVDKKGNLYISDAVFNIIRKVNTAGIISTVAGTSGMAGYLGNGGLATLAKLNRPHGMAFDAGGNLYIADAANHVVRKLDTFGKIWTIAGVGTMGYTGDGFPAITAELDSPYSVAVDGKGRIYIGDIKSNVIRRVETDGTINTFAGTGVAGYTGNNGPATAATFDHLADFAIDSIGNVFIADANNNVIRKVDTFGIVTTVAGNGTAGYGGDLGYVNGANFQYPYGITVDKNGSLIISDANNHRVRKTYYTVNINDVPAGAAIAAYPNPVHDFITVAGMEATDRVCVYNTVGAQVNIVAEENGSSRTLNLNGLAAGMYLVQVYDAQGASKSLFKIVKE